MVWWGRDEIADIDASVVGAPASCADGHRSNLGDVKDASDEDTYASR
jgi:hypothetical protein